MAEPIKGQAYEFFVSLTDINDPQFFIVNPTIASGDFKLSVDGGAFGNLATLPVVALRVVALRVADFFLPDLRAPLFRASGVSDLELQKPTVKPPRTASTLSTMIAMALPLSPLADRG